MPDDPELRELQMAQIRADIANKTADTEYKKGLLKYEPWKVVATAFAAGAGFLAAVTALATWVLSHLITVRPG